MTHPPGGPILTGRLLARNSLYNLAGIAVPVILGLVAIPFLVKGLGVPRFGVLTLAWGAVGYFNVFNLGLGRALAHAVAQRQARGRDDEVPTLVWTTLAATLALGAVAGAGLFLLAPPLAERILRVPSDLVAETLRAFRILAFALPFVVSAAALTGVLQARQRFDLLNLVGVPAAAWSYLGPLVALPFSASLVVVVAVLVVGRVLLWWAYLLLCIHDLPALRGGPILRPRMVGPLLRFGGWLTVTNVVSPVMAYLDRFFIGSLVSASAVAFYATPHEVVMRAAALPGSVVGVIFPGIAAARAPEEASRLVSRGGTMIFFIVFPVAIVFAAFAPELLGAWLGPEFARESAGVLRLLAVGLLVNALAMVPSTAVQAGGRPDLTAKLHLVELPLFLGALYFLASRYGIEGAAWAWVARVAVDGAALALVARWRFPAAGPALGRGAWLCAAGVAALAAASMPLGVGARAAVAAAAFVLFASVGWFRLLSRSERGAVRGWISRRWGGTEG